MYLRNNCLLRIKFAPVDTENNPFIIGEIVLIRRRVKSPLWFSL